jgi:hypothetical protein
VTDQLVRLTRAILASTDAAAQMHRVTPRPQEWRPVAMDRVGDVAAVAYWRLREGRRGGVAMTVLCQRQADGTWDELLTNGDWWKGDLSEGAGDERPVAFATGVSGCNIPDSSGMRAGFFAGKVAASIDVIDVKRNGKPNHKARVWRPLGAFVCVLVGGPDATFAIGFEAETGEPSQVIEYRFPVE